MAKELLWNDSNKSITSVETSEINGIVDNSNPIKDTTNKELLQEIISLPCPFPEWKEYLEIRESLSLEDQKTMQENIGKKDEEWKIEIIKMKCKFSLLMSENIDNEDIFSWDYIDSVWKTWMSWVIYFTWDSAEKEIEKQGKDLLTDTIEVVYFLSLFPWKNIEEQISNFVKLFKLKKAGFYSKLQKKWYNIWNIGYIRLSKQEWSENHAKEWKDPHKNLIRELQFGWIPHMRSLGKEWYPMPYVVKESM